MKRDFSPGIPVLLILLLINGQVSSQTDKPAQSQESKLNLITDLVNVEVIVCDRKTGIPVRGLGKEDFEIYEDGIKQNISHFSNDGLPLSIILLLDVSGSVRSVMGEIAEQAGKTLHQLLSDDEVALMSFRYQAKLCVDFTKDRNLIAEKLSNPNSLISDPDSELLLDATVIGDSIYQAAEALRRSSSPPGRRVIIIVTDNLPDNTGTRYSVRQVANQLMEAGCIVYGIRADQYKSASTSSKVIGSLPTSILGDAFYRIISRHGGNANTYSDLTGGVVLDGRKNKAAEKLAELIQMLRCRYSFGYTSSNPVMNGKFRKIKVKLRPEAEKRYGKVTILARQGYFARRPEQAK
ncbi:MAG: VWA domain-containing protein [Blastocatellia bacterium]